jgi:hypothetical protein
MMAPFTITHQVTHILVVTWMCQVKDTVTNNVNLQQTQIRVYILRYVNNLSILRDDHDKAIESLQVQVIKLVIQCSQADRPVTDV